MKRIQIACAAIALTGCQSIANKRSQTNESGVSQKASESDAAGQSTQRVDQKSSPATQREGEVIALCTVRETEAGVVHRLEFLLNVDLGMYEVDHVSVDKDLQESFRSYFARGVLQKTGISLDLQESVNGKKFAELKAEPKGANGLLLGSVVFTRAEPLEADNAECSVNF